MTARHVDLSSPRPDLTNQPLPELVPVCIRHGETIADGVAQGGTSLAGRLRWDNAVAESFFATLKTELVYTQTWRGRLELRQAVFEYIEAFYNRRRLHSSLGYRTPAKAENDFALAA